MNRKQRRALEKKGGNPTARQPGQLTPGSTGGTLSHLLAGTPSNTGPSIAEAMARGYALYREGRRGAAEKLFDQILARQPENAESLHMKGVLRYLENDFNNAVQFIEKAEQLQIKKDPNIPNNLGLALVGMKNFREARHAFDRALSLAPDFAQAWHNKAAALIPDERYEDAITALKKAAGLLPDHPETEAALGDILLRLGQQQAAEIHLRRALELKPSLTEARANLAACLIEQIRLDEAVGELAKIIAAEPAHAKSWFMRGTAEALAGRKDDSTNAFQMARELQVQEFEQRGFQREKVYIQLSRRCNLRCTMCGHHIWESNEGFMTMELFEHALDECAANGLFDIVILAAQGEPFLHPKIFEFLEYAVGRGFHVGIVSNGTPFTEERAERLAGTGIDFMQFSFAGWDKESYETTYVGGKFEQVTRNLRHIADALQKKRSRTQLTVKAVTSTDSADFVRKTQEFLDDLGDFRVLPVTPNNFGGTMKIGKYNEETELYSYRDVKHSSLSVCKILTQSVGIYFDGRVTACGCYDANGQLEIGNITQENLKDIMQGKKFRRILKAFEKGSVGHIPLCNKCDDPYGTANF
jgi:MoaA/NifB/PqqE/SkfB family radical SAM enzyme/Flp pilus assembly protein TadD